MMGGGGGGDPMMGGGGGDPMMGGGGGGDPMMGGGGGGDPMMGGGGAPPLYRRGRKLLTRPTSSLRHDIAFEREFLAETLSASYPWMNNEFLPIEGRVAAPDATTMVRLLQDLHKDPVYKRYLLSTGLLPIEVEKHTSSTLRELSSLESDFHQPSEHLRRLHAERGASALAKEQDDVRRQLQPGAKPGPGGGIDWDSIDWADESTWPPNVQVDMIPKHMRDDVIAQLTPAQLEQIGFFDDVKVTVAAGAALGDADAIASFAGSVSEAIPPKKIISFNVTSVANLNLFRDPADVYFPKNRFRPTVQETFESPQSLDAHIG